MRSRFAVACLALLLAACGSPPKERYYTLTAAPGAAGSAAGASASSIAVGPVTVPETVDQPQLVVQVAANQVTMWSALTILGRKAVGAGQQLLAR